MWYFGEHPGLELKYSHVVSYGIFYSAQIQYFFIQQDFSLVKLCQASSPDISFQTAYGTDKILNSIFWLLQKSQPYMYNLKHENSAQNRKHQANNSCFACI